jgi:tetratricopeptide (TPR) repeat protein
MRLSLTIIGTFYSLLLFAQNADLVKGNRMFKEGKFAEAEAFFRKALSTGTNPVASYNLGSSLYKSDNSTEAIRFFDEAAQHATDPGFKSKALYNKGVVEQNNKQLPEAIESYKETLRLNPYDQEARTNLQIALRSQKQQQPKEENKPKKEDPKPEPKKQPQKPPPNKLTKKQAEQYLKALTQKERELQEKMQKKTGGPARPEKDW